MIRIQIGKSERTIADADPSWINDQINRRRQDGLAVCVRVQIDDALANMMLTTLACDGAGGGNRPPNSQEREIFDLWEKHGLNKDDFAPANLVTFLKQLMRLVRD
jgi:hypothetical protein